MSVYRVIDKLESYVREGTWLPLGHRILSEERLVEYIEKMRSTLPEEVGRAKVISTNKDRVIREAQDKAQQIVTEAMAQKNDLVEQQDIVIAARTTADIVLREAEEKAKKIRAGRRFVCGRCARGIGSSPGNGAGFGQKGTGSARAAAGGDRRATPNRSRGALETGRLRRAKRSGTRAHRSP